ncbi:protein NLRC3-like isoform X1, partial [Lates japonicus]
MRMRCAMRLQRQPSLKTEIFQPEPEPEYRLDPELSCLSLKSKSEPLLFKDALSCCEQSLHQRPQSCKPEPDPGSDLEPSCVSLKSKAEPLLFKDGLPCTEERVNQGSSEEHSGPPVQQEQTQLDSTFMMLELNIITFMKNELKKMQKVLSPDYPECLESQREDEEVLDGKDKEQRRSSREAFLKITLNFLRTMKEEELADCLQS